MTPRLLLLVPQLRAWRHVDVGGRWHRLREHQDPGLVVLGQDGRVHVLVRRRDGRVRLALSRRRWSTGTETCGARTVNDTSGPTLGCARTSSSGGVEPLIHTNNPTYALLALALARALARHPGSAAAAAMMRCQRRTRARRPSGRINESEPRVQPHSVCPRCVGLFTDVHEC